ncbi:lachesin-like isoform X2 [Eriocheir sinensis]|uniref:lachesin-like isoform X2 n=1 Tax=Eriocheir sinensis TaxID=95602 RepID=UPI0021C9E71E|nr:lachesin-like isoform X2 [Eriocheir sinensis]
MAPPTPTHRRTPPTTAPSTPTEPKGGVWWTRGRSSGAKCCSVLGRECFVVVILTFSLLSGVCAGQPDFAAPLNNVSVPVGRDATFSCVVNDLGGYRVGWVKADTKAIQAIHKHVITHNSRVSVSHSDHNTWMLHIRGVQEEDRGPYMCQINTDPMRSQIGHLEVTVPPEILDATSSSDVMVPEGSNAALSCTARGYPRPSITWIREDKKPLSLRTNDVAKPKEKHMSFEGAVLNLTQITRSDMGPYLCIANNQVPPPVSKRIIVQVTFRPVIHVPNQLIGVPLGSTATLVCNLEASPKSIQYWTRDSGEMIITNNDYQVSEKLTNYYMTTMTLNITAFQRQHAGVYLCTAKNSLGETQGRIEVYEIDIATPPPEEEEEEKEVEEEAEAEEDGADGGRGTHTTGRGQEMNNEVGYGGEGGRNGHLPRPHDPPNRYQEGGRRGHGAPNTRPNLRGGKAKDSSRRFPHGEDAAPRPTRNPWWGEESSAPSPRFSPPVALLGVALCLGLAAPPGVVG